MYATLEIQKTTCGGGGLAAKHLIHIMFQINELLQGSIFPLILESSSRRYREFNHLYPWQRLFCW